MNGSMATIPRSEFAGEALALTVDRAASAEIFEWKPRPQS